MKIQTFIVDAFTDRPFKGNPAGVCLLNTSINAGTMQSIASELNLSETAFLLQTNNGHYTIRYFTPSVEVDFCGHATLASSKIIMDKLGKTNVDFTARNGLKLNAGYANDFINLKFPLYDTTAYITNPKLYEALGIKKHISTRLSKDLDMLVIEVRNKQTLLNIEPNYQKLMESSNNLKEVVITTKSEDDGYDFYSRCFAPWLGINEDPVTGASHSVLAKYWGDKLLKKKMAAYQLSNRGGFLKLNILSDTELEVMGKAQIVFEGELKL